MSVEIIVGDALTELRRLPSESVDCVVTSPPYWGLRDYGVDGQLGLERTLGEHLAVLVDVFREVRRVLKVRGTLWLNYGDCYAAAPNGKSAAAYKADGSDDRTFRDKPFSTVGPIYDPSGGRSGGGVRGDNKGNTGGTNSGRIVAGGFLKPKDLCMIPNRLAIALQDDGWYVRSEIIWHKPNPMPESVYDRPTSAHEKVWLLTKSEEYFYDHEVIREPAIGAAAGNKDRKLRSEHGGNSGRNSHQGYGVPWAGGATRNARNVWTIPPRAFSDAHFATFPPELARRCIAAGTPESVCGACGAVDHCGGLCSAFDRVPGRVLDPFGGSGTVGLVAETLQRDSVLIELNAEYAAIARRRVGLDDAMAAA